MAFTRPEKLCEGVRILVYGESGSGKTPFALTFPSQALIDADSSATFYKNNNQNILVMSTSVSAKAIMEDLSELEADSELFSQVNTIVIDSISRVYENLQHAALKVVENRAIKNQRMVEAEGLSPKEWGIIKLVYDRLIGKLFEYSKMGKNIVIVAEGKDEKEPVKQPDGTVTFVTVGTTYNSSKGAEYDFDVVLQFSKNKDGSSIARVIKDRTMTFTPNNVIEMATYEHWKDSILQANTGRVRSREEIEKLDSVIDKDANEFKAGGGKLEEIVTSIKEVARQKMKEGVPKDKLVAIVGASLDYSSLQEAENVLNKLKSLKG